MKILFLLGLAICLFGQSSDRPAPTPTKTSSKPQEKTAQNAPVTTTPPKDLQPTPTTANAPVGKNQSTPYTCKQDNASLSNFLLTVFTGLLAYVGYLQYRTLKKQAEWMKQNVEVTEGLVTEAKTSSEAAKNSATTAEKTVSSMDKTAEMQLRAYVQAIKAERDGGKGTFDKDPFIGNVTIKNCGKTPAYDCRLVTQISFVVPSSTPCPQVIWDDTVPKFVLAPNQEIRFALKPLPLLKPEHEAVNNGLKQIHIRGHIKYRDAFEHNRTTKFHMQTSGIVDFGVGIFIPCDEGNEAD